jgi:hypothetical protein
MNAMLDETESATAPLAVSGLIHSCALPRRTYAALETLREQRIDAPPHLPDTRQPLAVRTTLPAATACAAAQNATCRG